MPADTWAAGMLCLETAPADPNHAPFVGKRADIAIPAGRPRPTVRLGAYSNGSTWRVGLRRVVLRK